MSTGYTLLSRSNLHFSFWHSGTVALTAEHQSARMSEIKNVGTDGTGWHRTLRNVSI